MNKTFACAAAAVIASAMLVACGGGSSTSTSPPTEVPASATASIPAFVDYLGSLAPSETQEPLNIAAAVPPTSETAEPLPID